MGTDDGLNTTDHDLLVSLNENMKFVRSEMSAMKSQVGGQIADHEARLRLQEATNERNEGAIRAIRGIGSLTGLILLVAQIGVMLWVGLHK